MGNRKRPAGERYAQIIRIFVFAVTVVCAAALLPGAVSAQTYVITDGSRIVTYTTAIRAPEKILAQAGIRLEEHDSYLFTGESEIAVCRAKQIRLLYHGEESFVSSPGESVRTLLNRLGITPEEGDVLSHDPDTITYDGMVLRVDAVTRRLESYTSTLCHETDYCNDPALPAGTEEVLIPGKDGELQRTAEVTYVNGVESHREVLTESVRIPAVTELVSLGTGSRQEPEPAEKQLVIGDGYILLPTGELLTYVKTDTVRATGYTHTDAGCDMITSTGTTVQRGTVAVDPRFIPYGTRMFIVSNDGKFVYGLAVAEDCGGAIKRDRMDLYFPTYNECIQFGYRRCTIYFLG